MTTTGTAQRREADLLLGRKCVWEFDPHTRGWKLVVDADVNITDIQIGAVEIKDHTTDDRAHVDSSHLLHVFDHASTGAFVLVWVTYDYPEDSPFANEDYGAFILGVRQHDIGSPVDAEGDFQGFIFNDQGQLHTYTTGSSVDTELPDPITLTGSLGLVPIGPFAGALGYGWDTSVLNRGWVPLMTADGGETLAHPRNMLVTKAFMQGAGQGVSTSYNVEILRPNSDVELWESGHQLLKTSAALYATDGSGTFARLHEGMLSDIYPNPDYALEVGAFGMGYDPIEGLWERLLTDGGGRLRVEAIWATGSAVAGPVDTELPDAIAMNDAMATPTTPLIGGINLAYHDSAGTYYRVRGHPEGLGDNLDSDYFDFNMNVNSIIWGRNVGGDYDRMRSEGASGSFAFRTSSYVETEDGFGALINKTVTDWASRDLIVFHSGTHVTIVSGSAVQLIDADGDMALIDAAGNLMVNLGVRLDATNDSIAIPHAIGISGSYSIDWPAAGIGVSGTVMVDTELPAAVLLADAMANPTAPAVASHLMGYNGVTWDRVYVGISGSVLVDLATRLDKTNDEVTAYVTGTVDTELPAAAALSDAMANPTTPLIGAAVAAFDEVAGQWERARSINLDSPQEMVDISPTMVVGAVLRAEYMSGGTWYQDGVRMRLSPAWQNYELLVHHSGTHVTVVTGSAVAIHGQTRTIERSIINITGTAGEYMLITGVAGRQVKVTEVMAIVSADTELIFESGWTGTWLSGKMSVPADGDGFFCEACATPDQHHFETESSNMLVLRLIAGAQVGGWINWYYE